MRAKTKLSKSACPTQSIKFSLSRILYVWASFII